MTAFVLKMERSDSQINIVPFYIEPNHTKVSQFESLKCVLSDKDAEIPHRGIYVIYLFE